MTGKIVEIFRGYAFIERGGGQPNLYLPGREVPDKQLPLFEGDIVNYEVAEDTNPRYPGKQIATKISLHTSGTRTGFSTDNPRGRREKEQGRGSGKEKKEQKKPGTPIVRISGPLDNLQISVELPNAIGGEQISLFVGEGQNLYAFPIKEEIVIGNDGLGMGSINLSGFNGEYYLVAKFGQGQPGKAELPKKKKVDRLKSSCDKPTVSGKWNDIWFLISFQTFDAEGKKNPEHIQISSAACFSLCNAASEPITVELADGSTGPATNITYCKFTAEGGSQLVRANFIGWETNLHVIHPEQKDPVVLHLKYDKNL